LSSSFRLELGYDWAVVLPSAHQILVVEDDADLRRIYRTALTLAGFGVQEAVDGIEALRRLDHNPPDLIVLEIVLPDISGVALAQEVAAHVHTREIPIVVVTSSRMDLRGLPVIAVLRKPVTPEQLLVAVRNGIGKKPAGTG
jgi:CheY-like chemotaxis protein